MKGNAAWLMLAGALLLLVINRRKPRSRLERAVAAGDARYLEGPAFGLSIEDGRLVVLDYHRWVKWADRRMRRAVNEGALAPSHIAARLFYEAFPDYDWPPPDEDSELAQQYDAIVATMAENLDDALRPVRVLQAKDRGLKLVD